jgi:hypothetical protein
MVPGKIFNVSFWGITRFPSTNTVSVFQVPLTFPDTVTDVAKIFATPKNSKTQVIIGLKIR